MLQCDNIRCCFQNFEHIDKRLMCPHARFLSTSKFQTCNRHKNHVMHFHGKISKFSLTTCPKMKVILLIVDFYVFFLFHTPCEIGARN